MIKEEENFPHKKTRVLNLYVDALTFCKTDAEGLVPKSLLLHSIDIMKTENPEQSKLALAMTLGGVMSSNIIGGIIVGYLLDKWLGTGPWLIITGIVLGTAGALAGVYRITSRLNQK